MGGAEDLSQMEKGYLGAQTQAIERGTPTENGEGGDDHPHACIDDRADDAAAEGLQRMAKRQSDWLVVMENERMVGIMTSRGLARFLDIQEASTE
jgi:hypothetical protein